MSKCVNNAGKMTFTNGVCPDGFESLKQKGYNDNNAPVEYGRYTTDQLYAMNRDTIYRIWKKLDRNDPEFDALYACRVERVLDYHSEIAAREGLENSTSFGEMEAWASDYVSTKIGIKLYCK